MSDDIDTIYPTDGPELRSFAFKLFDVKISSVQIIGTPCLHFFCNAFHDVETRCPAVGNEDGIYRRVLAVYITIGPRKEAVPFISIKFSRLFVEDAFLQARYSSITVNK